MSEMAAVVRSPLSVEGSFRLPSTGLADCDLAPGIPGEDSAALSKLGITRSVQHRIPTDAVSLTPLQGVLDDRSATRFVIDAPPPDDATLRRLHDLGVRGVRYGVPSDPDAAAQFDAINRDADRLAPLDWHVELAVGADLAVLARHEWELTQLPVALCLGDVTPAIARLGIESEGVGFLLDLLHMGRTWVKLGGAIAYEELRSFVNAALAVRSDRLLWGSRGDEPASQPSDRVRQVAARLAALERLIPDEDDRAAVLVSNPARLYGFA